MKESISHGENKNRIEKIAIAILVLVVLIAIGNVYLLRSELSRAWRSATIAAVQVSTLAVPNESFGVVSSDYTVASGKSFNVSFDHKNKVGGTAETYGLRYKCEDGLALKMVHDNGKEEPIFCDSLFDISALGTTTLTLMPSVTGVDSAGTTLDIVYSRTGINEKTLEGSINLEVVKSTTSTNTVKSATSATVTPAVAAKPAPSATNLNAAIKSALASNTAIASAKTNVVIPRTAGAKTEELKKIGDSVASVAVAIPKLTSNPNGIVDLSTRILQIGMVDKTTNAFTVTSNLKHTDRIAVRFEVLNVGTKTSPSWTFSAPLPTYPFYIYQSNTEPPLAPGDRVEFTIGFDNIEKSEGNLVMINVDPSNQINDNNRKNNIATTTINGIKP